ncbi:MAG: metallophosphoesterase family protein [Bryobacteraceae bacterium]
MRRYYRHWTAIAAGVVGIALLSGAADPGGGSDFQFAIVGDRTGGAQRGVYEQVWQEIGAWHPNFVVTVGDTIEGGNDGAAEAEWRDLRPLWRRYRGPIYFTPGNHDIWSAKSRRVYEKESGRPAHYSFDYQEAHFTILDNSGAFSLDSREMGFLASDLERNKARKLKFVFFHQPFWLLPLKLQNMNFPFHQLMRKYGAQYVVSAHVHQFSRMERDGIVYMVVGSSGGRLRGHDPFKDFAEGWFYQWVRVRVKGSRIEAGVKEVDAPLGKGREVPGEDWGENGLK